MERLEERSLLSLAFAPPIPFPSSTDQTSFASGDFNGDGIPDLVETDQGVFSSSSGYTKGLVSVKLGRGDGTFGPVSSIDFGDELPISAAVGDFNGDGQLDFLVGEDDAAFTSYQPPPYYDPWYGTIVTPPPIVTQIRPSHLAVFLGRGDGSFQTGLVSPSDQRPVSVAVADFNGDGKSDLAVAGGTNYANLDGGASVLLGHGDGTFSTASTSLDIPPYGQEKDDNPPVAVAAADFNGDGKPDLVLVKQGEPYLSLGDVLGDGPKTADLLLGHGDGTFDPPTAFNLGDIPVYRQNGDPSLLVGDFNGDGRPDLAEMLSSGLGVVLNQGDGSFQAPQIYQSGSAAALGDFNRDGRLDIAVAGGSGTVDVLAGQGDGTFLAPRTLSTSLYHQTYALGDLNGDGKPDLITVSNVPSRSLGGTLLVRVGVGLGSGNGAFGPEPDFDLPDLVGLALPSNPNLTESFSLGDVNGDGRLDLAVALVSDAYTPTGDRPPNGQVLVLKGRGDGTFDKPVKLSLGTDRVPTAITLGDVNGDGNPDLSVVYQRISSPTDITIGASVSFGHGDGTFDAPIDLPGSVSEATPAATASSVTVGDLNSDGKPDLALTEAATDEVLVYLNLGDGTFSAPVHLTAGPSAGPVVINDLNGDGKPDLVVVARGNLDNGSDTYADSRVVVLLGHGDGTFDPTVPVASPLGTGWFNGVSVRDVNDDCKPDLVATEQGGKYTNSQDEDAFSNGSVDVLLGQGDGTFLAPVSYTAGSFVNTPDLLDVNGDGRSDLIVQDGTPVLRINLGGGTFARKAPHFPLTPAPTALLSADFNRDGKPDLAALDKKGGTGTGVVLLNQTAVTDFPISAQAVPVQAVAGSTNPVVVASIDDLDPLGLASDFHVSINWGDGTPDSSGTVTPDGPGHFLISGRHAYARAGTFPIHVTVLDILGSTADTVGSASVTMPSINVTSTTTTEVSGQSHTITVSLTKPDGTPFGAGVPVTFSITTGPNAGTAGTTNPANGRTGASGQVRFTYLGLGGAGTDTIIASATLPGGAILTSSPALVTWTTSTAPVGPPAPTVVSLQRFGYHRHPTRLVLSFSEPMDSARVESLRNYRLFLNFRGRHIPIRLRRALYNPMSQSVTLLPARLLPLRFTYQISANGAAPYGLASTSGTPLDGRGDGEPGTHFEARIDRSSLFLPSPRRGHGHAHRFHRRGHRAALLIAARRRSNR